MTLQRSLFERWSDDAEIEKNAPEKKVYETTEGEKLNTKLTQKTLKTQKTQPP